jgi:Spy/CpxP family protein refolding chaperone
MKGVQLANSNIQSAAVVKTNRVYLFIRSMITFFLTGPKKYVPAIMLFCSIHVHAQQNNLAVADTAYQRVIAERTAKIVNTLEITEFALRKKVQEQIADQYFKLNNIDDESKTTVTAIKAKPLSKEEIADAVKKEEENKSEKLKQLHTQFIGQLKTILTDDQIEKVKDGMTYRILPVTWAAYMDMLQKLTQEQKDKMYAWLVEARELSMDEGSSEKKHAVFGKYKGRINNYLSAEGYDMKKEGDEWAKRIQAAKETKQTQN